VVRACSGHEPASRELRPGWGWALKAIESANAHPEHTGLLLRRAGRRARLWGRCESSALSVRLAISSIAAVVAGVLGLVAAGSLLWFAACWVWRLRSAW
jgi:hypothetical protein